MANISESPALWNPTEEWVTSLLYKKYSILPQYVKISKLQGGGGYASKFYHIQIIWGNQKDPNLSSAVKLPASALLKAATYKIMASGKIVTPNSSNDQASGDHENDLMSELLLDVQRIECNVYDFFGKRHTKPPMPKSYITSAADDVPPFILMEDLRKEATIARLIDGLTMDQIKSVLRALAQLHGSTMGCAEVLTGFKRLDQRQMKVVTDFTFAQNQANREDFPDIWKYTDYDIASLVDLDKFYKMTDPNGGTFVPCMVHGDMWNNNLLFRRQQPSLDSSESEETTDKVLAIIDWQVAHAGICVEDIARLMCSSVTTDIRRNHIEELMMFYYEQLKAFMPEGVAVPFTFPELLDWYRKLLPFGCNMMVLQLALHNRGKFRDYPLEVRQEFAHRMADAIEDGLVALKS